MLKGFLYWGLGSENLEHPPPVVAVWTWTPLDKILETGLHSEEDTRLGLHNDINTHIRTSHMPAESTATRPSS